jgi:hypothetical protein
MEGTMPTDLLMYDVETIQLTADDDDHNGFRVHRLNRLVGYVQSLADTVGTQDLLDHVKSIHDHEGSLTITWKRAPTQIEKNMFYKGWDSRVCDGGDASITTEHTVER